MAPIVNYDIRARKKLVRDDRMISSRCGNLTKVWDTAGMSN